MADNTGHFSGKAAVYAAARPDYAAAALDFICSFLKPGAAIADVGAGTGKFTAQLAERGFAVTAIEPNEDMLSHLRTISSIKVVQAPAENTTLPDHSMDAITAAQAFHWFDQTLFTAEAQRILKPGGKIFIVYNDHNYVPSEELLWYPGADLNWKKDYTENLQVFFGEDMRCERFPNPKSYDRERYLANMSSHSHAPKPGDEVFERYVQSVHAIFDRTNVDGLITTPYETVVYTA